MILPNLIKDHGFELPDICDFPDAGESLYPEDLDFEPYDTKFFKCFSKKDTELFNKTYNNFCNDLLKKVTLDKHEREILNEMSKRVKAAVDSYFISCKEQVDRPDIKSTPVYEQLEEEGCAGYKVDETFLNQVRTLLSKDIQKLQKQPDTKPGNVHSYDRIIRYKKLNSPKLFDLVTKIMKQQGGLPALRKYNRNKKNIEVVGVGLHISRPTDQHHLSTLEDMPTTSKLISLHSDPKYNLMKAIVYLNEVDLHNGPFSTIPTSNRWYHDPFEKAIANGNSTGNYLNSPAHRKVLRIFPEVMRKNTIFGRYILDGTRTSDMLLEKIHPFTSDEADCIIFDPANTMHRGGLCETGERINLQILMR